MNRGLLSLPKRGTHEPFVGIGMAIVNDQSLTSGAIVPIKGERILFDSGGFTTCIPASKFIIPITGVYSFTINAIISPNSAGVRSLRIVVNGAIKAATRIPAVQAVTHAHILETKLAVNCGDIIEFMINQNSGSTLVLWTEASSLLHDSQFSMVLLGTLP